jgi:hypothetical protein
LGNVIFGFYTELCTGIVEKERMYLIVKFEQQGYGKIKKGSLIVD